jgi:acylphosphatase
MQRESRRVFYSGRVQGVGFRFTTQHLSRGFDVAGTVRNLPDGRVELVAEGEPAEIDGFLQAIRDAMGRFIRDESGESIPPSPTPFTNFTIRH